jgi:hypothetical protein
MAYVTSPLAKFFGANPVTKVVLRYNWSH